jgi:hypothetical protein
MGTRLQRHFKRALLGAACASLFGANGLVSADPEVEPNDAKAQAQVIVIPSSGSATASGMVGTVSGGMTTDLDMYAFDAKEGDVPNLMVVSDGAWDTLLGLYDSAGNLLDTNDDAVTMNPGSTSPFDSRIDTYRISLDGTYYVAVTPIPRYLGSGYTVINPSSTIGGAYDLMIQGVTPQDTGGGPPPVPEIKVVTVQVRQKHWDDADEPEIRINRKLIPVAIHSTPEFNAVTEVDKASLTFGATGIEESMFRCRKNPKDVNYDGLKDLVCFYKMEESGFKVGDVQGFLKGATVTGEQFEGSAALKVIEVSKKKHDGWHKRHKIDPRVGPSRSAQHRNKKYGRDG